MDPTMPVLENMAGRPEEVGVPMVPVAIQPDISNDSTHLLPGFVNTRPKRGRPVGVTDRTKPMGVKKKGQENKKKATELAPFEKEGPLSREDVKCTICMSIFIEPVILPCKHCLCLECYRSSMEKATLCCPICRCRLSSWGRKNTSQLVNKEFWERIKTQFPDEVEARLQGQDSQDFTSYDSPSKPVMRDGFAAQEGEIRLELENIQKQHDQDLETQKRKEAEASSELIRQLQEEEGPPQPVQSPTQVMKDFELAQKLQEEEERERQATRLRALASSRLNAGVSTSTHSSSVRKPSSSSNSRKRGNETIAFSTPTAMAFKRVCTTDSQHKQNKITSFFEPAVVPRPRCRSGTPDSINLEFSQHFTPISPAPKTPPKRNKDGSVDQLVFVKSRPVRRDLSIEFGMFCPNPNSTREPEVGREGRIDFELIRTDEFDEPLESGSAVGSDYGPANDTGQESFAPNTTGADLDLEVENTNGNETPNQAQTQLPDRIEPDLDSSKEYEYEARFANGRELEHQNAQGDRPLRSVEHYLENLGSSNSVVMGSEESDSEQLQHSHLVNTEEEDRNPRPVTSPIPLDDPHDSDHNSSEFEFSLSSAERLENARALEKWKQEEEDRKFALKLQRELNKPVVNRDKYLLRAPEERRKAKNIPAAAAGSSAKIASDNIPNQPSTSTKVVFAGKMTSQVSKPATNGNKALIFHEVKPLANGPKPFTAPSNKPSTSAMLKPATPVSTRNSGRSNLKTATPKRPTRSSLRQSSINNSVNKIENYLVRSSERVKVRAQYVEDSTSSEASSIDSNESSWTPSMQYSTISGFRFQNKATSPSTRKSQLPAISVSKYSPNKNVEPLMVRVSEPSPNKNVEPLTVTVKESKPSPNRNGEPLTPKESKPSPNKNGESLTVKESKPSSNKNGEPLTVNESKPSPNKNVEPLTVKVSEPSPNKNVEPSTVKDLKPSPNKNGEPLTVKESKPSPNKIGEASAVEEPVKDLRRSPIKQVKPPMVNGLRTSPRKNVQHLTVKATISSPNHKVQLLTVVDTKLLRNNVQPLTYNTQAQGSVNGVKIFTVNNAEAKLSQSATGTPLRVKSLRERRRPRRFSSSSSSSGSSTGAVAGTPNR